MLTPEQTAIIKATVPLLETGGEALTTHFYKVMLGEYPQVRPLFNQAHQASGAQPRALANSVLMYANNIDKLQALGPLAAQIINKHVALQVQPEHYPIVGACLLRAIREVLGAEIATDAVIDAWGAAYQQLADQLIGAEAGIYDQLAAAPGGWRGGRAFRVARKVAESAEIASFYLEPVDGKPVLDFTPGQYLGVQLMIDGQEVRRNYSLSAAANGRSYRISVKREPHGLASGFLHDQVREGDVLEVFPPAGDFVLRDGDSPLVLISGGVGVTPTLAMAEAALADGKRDVTFLHYARNKNVQAFKETLEGWAARYPRFRGVTVYEQGDSDVRGRPEIGHLQRYLPEGLDCDVYFLGPKPFMAAIKKSLTALGLPEERLRYEFFGPAEVLD
ncbi:NO-inducible flavohemoprotein [Acidocella aminolytica]|jgi:nitric oxide dioxygenase|uniref:Flavohemoprotein n=1 Tax=Acidocella aminolytica 101 = DSM 11237 TaxID=1120923 RepID=A0A0D6PD40_9PROT|nr:NO-inducible flavohemoprotein [Acidocella aminolytica]GAN79660.1 flavohemoprotein [Acidocella aminolytica 101 = DSM 11237]GBQ41320.1 flavohemoprotein [Acidocella aminolytica 101 = DSM 11237]SHF05266.1 nitric oxide dioxygenase [Acidocella aminolytica 101 = DSM 11237]